MKIDIDLDLSQFKGAVAAQVEPAIAEVMTELDIRAKVKECLLERRWSIFGSSRGSALDLLINEEVEQEVRRYVQSVLRENQPFLHEELRKMMAESQSKFVRAITSSVDDALENFSFELNVNASVDA